MHELVSNIAPTSSGLVGRGAHRNWGFWQAIQVWNKLKNDVEVSAPKHHTMFWHRSEDKCYAVIDD